MRHGDKTIRHLAPALAALLLLIAPLAAWGEQENAAPASEAKPAGDVVTITGMVKTARYSARSETAAVYIDVLEEPILVSRRLKGKELLTQVGATIRASGYVRDIRTDESFTKIIDVTEYVVEAPPVKKPRKTASDAPPDN